MKKYIVFCFDAHEPNGGIQDIYETQDNLEDATATVARLSPEFDIVYIVDRDTWEKVS